MKKLTVKILCLIMSATILSSCGLGFLSDDEEAFYKKHYGYGRVNEKGMNQGVVALISCCEYYADMMVKTSQELGLKWVYTNSSKYAKQSGTFDEMIESKQVGGNCASLANWAFLDLGIMPYGSHFWGDQSDNFHNYEQLAKYIDPCCEVTTYVGLNKHFNELYMANDVLPGDIFLANGHTFIYRGDDTFYASGHDGSWHSDYSAPTEDSQHAVFDSWIKSNDSCADFSYRVNFRIRLRDNFVPKFYRDETGKLVENPLFDPETSVIYDPTKIAVYDTTGKTNVLLEKTLNKADSYNLRSISRPAVLTDGSLYYDNLAEYYTDFCIDDELADMTDRKEWYDANGNVSGTKDDTFKYICGFKIALDDVQKVDSFKLYSQAVGASSGTPIGDIDGFDILVSVDGENWTVAYSANELSCTDSWIKVDDPNYVSEKGHPTCHYTEGKFDGGACEAKYIQFALTAPRCTHADKAAQYNYETLTPALNYFRISELMVYKA